MATEIWKDIPGYEGAYQVSSLGRVRSLDRYVEVTSSLGNSFTTRRKGKLLSPGHTRNYSYVNLYPGARVWLVHRLVALAFFGPCPEGCEVRHLDGDERNNVVWNLAYGTHVANEADKLKHGTRQRVCKLSEEQVREIRTRIENGESNTSLGKEYGVSDVVISNIRLGKNYRWVA